MGIVIDEKNNLLAVFRPSYLNRRRSAAIRDVSDVINVKRVLNLVVFGLSIKSVEIPSVAVILEYGSETTVGGWTFNHALLSDKDDFFSSNNYWHDYRSG